MDATVFVHIVNDQGVFVTGQDMRPRGGEYPTQVWQAGEGIVDEHLVPLPADLPAGRYWIKIGMYDSVSQARLPIVAPDPGSVSDNILQLGPFTKGK